MVASLCSIFFNTCQYLATLKENSLVEAVYNKSTAANHQSILTKIDHKLPGWIGTFNKIFNVREKITIKYIHAFKWHRYIWYQQISCDIHHTNIPIIHSQSFESFDEKYSHIRHLEPCIDTAISLNDWLIKPWPQHFRLSRRNVFCTSITRMSLKFVPLHIKSS